MIRTREIYKNGVLIATEEYDDGITPLHEWKTKIASTDTKLPRCVEDIIDVLEAPVKARLSSETLSLYEEKKRIRAEKPVTK